PVHPTWFRTMTSWLHAHASTCPVGSPLVLFHSAFQVRTPIAALTSMSLGIVVSTGLIGLYLHALIPKAGLRPLHSRLGELAPLLPGLVERVNQFVLAAPITALPHDASLLRSLF